MFINHYEKISQTTDIVKPEIDITGFIVIYLFFGLIMCIPATIFIARSKMTNVQVARTYAWTLFMWLPTIILFLLDGILLVIIGKAYDNSNFRSNFWYNFGKFLNYV